MPEIAKVIKNLFSAKDVSSHLGLHIVLIVLLSFAVYANTLHNGFHIDDIERIVNNPGIRTFQPIMRHFVDPFTISSKPEHMVRMIFDHVITDTNHDIGTVKTASDIVVGLQTYRSEGKFV